MKPVYKIASIALVIILGIISFSFLWRKLTAPSPEPMIQPGGELPISGDEGTPDAKTPEEMQIGATLKRLSETPVFFAWALESGEVFYLSDDGKVWSAKEGPDLEIATQTFNAMNSAEANAKGDKVLLSFGAPDAPEWGVFDAIDKVWRPLPRDLRSATWATSTEKLIAVAVGESSGEDLVEVDLSKNPPTYRTLVKNFAFRDVTLKAVPPQSLYITERPSASYASRVWILDLKDLTFNLVKRGERGFWMKMEQGLIFAANSPNTFFVLNEEFQNLLPTFWSTFPSKCTAANSILAYCFVPQNFPPNSQPFAADAPVKNFPDDFLQNRYFGNDDLYELVLPTVETRRLLRSGKDTLPPLDAKNPLVANGNLYFTNRYDGMLYVLTPPPSEILEMIGD